jgi:hypothetical protein
MGATAASAAMARMGCVSRSSTAQPISMSSDAMSCTTPVPTKVRTCSTSLVRRVSSCPVCAWS